MRAILLDIEGTTTPVEFVYDVLFPYVRDHVGEFLGEHYGNAEVHADLEQLRKDCAADAAQKPNPALWRDDSHAARLESAVACVHWLMERDSKSTALKSLQGKICEAGYRSGQLRGAVYEDVPPALARWYEQAKEIAIFSSGSVLAQRLLFSTTPAGDLTHFISAYFDTTTGPKREASSYRRISAALRMLLSEVLFLSDVTAELDAAQIAGMQTALCVRPGRPEPPSSAHQVIHAFDEIIFR